jgi:hypothetical protein
LFFGVVLSCYSRFVTAFCKHSDAESGSHTPLGDRKACFSGAEREYLRSSNTRAAPDILAAARSHFGSNSPPDCYSLPKCRYATRRNTSGLWFFISSCKLCKGVFCF